VEQRKPEQVSNEGSATDEAKPSQLTCASNFVMLLSMRRSFILITLLSFSIVTQTAFAQAPLQADVRLRVNYNDRRLISFHAGLEGGDAVLRGTVRNLPGGEIALVQLQFDYRTGADIALDELISQIVIATSDQAGNEFSKVKIDPDTVPLNPNRVALYYSGTVYRPPPAGRRFFVVRIQVFGNYE
jgi:hypothetical protein